MPIEINIYIIKNNLIYNYLIGTSVAIRQSQNQNNFVFKFLDNKEMSIKFFVLEDISKAKYLKFI